MTKYNFNELINYLRARPTEARRLLDVLLNGEDDPHVLFSDSSSVSDQWLTAKEVGSRVGMSARWVKERVKYLPTEAVRQQEQGRRTIHINYPIVEKMLIEMKTA